MLLYAHAVPWTQHYSRIVALLQISCLCVKLLHVVVSSATALHIKKRFYLYHFTELDSCLLAPTWSTGQKFECFVDWLPSMACGVMTMHTHTDAHATQHELWDGVLCLAC